MRRLVSLTSILLLFFAVSAAAATVRVTQKRAPLRAEPKADSAVLAEYKAGDLLELLDARGDWFKVRDPRSGQEGFILSALAELLPGPIGDAGVNPAGRERPAGAEGPGPDAPAKQGASGPVTAGSQKGGSAKAAPVPPHRWTDIGYIAVDGLYQGGSKAFSDNYSLSLYGETGSVNTKYPKKDGPSFDVNGTFRVWRNLALGIGVNAIDRSTTGQVAATVPHPFFFNEDRSATGTVALSRRETAVHLQAACVVPVSRRLLVALSAGPSFFQVEQSLVDSAKFVEAYPYDTVALGALSATKSSKSVVGFNVGVDAAYYFTRYVGFGATARFTRADASFTLHGTGVSTTAGGFQGGVGLRVRIPGGQKKKATTPGGKPRS